MSPSDILRAVEHGWTGSRRHAHLDRSSSTHLLVGIRAKLLTHEVEHRRRRYDRLPRPCCSLAGDRRAPVRDEPRHGRCSSRPASHVGPQVIGGFDEHVERLLVRGCYVDLAVGDNDRCVGSALHGAAKGVVVEFEPGALCGHCRDRTGVPSRLHVDAVAVIIHA